MDILNEKIEGLVKKAEKSKMPYGILKKVYDRGMAAWKTGHRPGTTPQQWAFARVNSFITKSSGTWGKADADLAKQVRGEEVEKRTTAKSMLGQVREARYEIEFDKGEVGQVIADRPGSLADEIQSELDSKRIRAKVKSTGDEFKLEFNTSIPQRKMLKILNDKLDLTVFPEQNKLLDFVNEVSGPQLDIYYNVGSEKKAQDLIVKLTKRPEFKNKIGIPYGRGTTASTLPPAQIKHFRNGALSLGGTKETHIAFQNALKKQMSDIKLYANPKDSRDTITTYTKYKFPIKPIKEKLDKDADAGDYVKDFKKSDAPQFKGKSDKKKQKMAIAAYLDSKEEVKEENLQELINFDRQLKDPKKEVMVMFTKGPDKGRGFVIDKKDLSKFERQGVIHIESNDIQENNKENYMWGHINMAMMKAGLNPRVIRDVLSNLNKFKKMRVKVEDNIQEALKFKYAVVDTSKNNEVIAMSSDEKDMQDTMRRRKERSLKVVKLKRPTTNDKMIGYPLKEENCPDCDEDPCKCKSLQESHKGDKMNEDNITEEKEINQLNEFEHIISFIGKDGLPAYYLDKIFKGSGPAHVAVRKLEKKTGSKRYSVMKYPPAKGKSEFDKKKRDFKKEDISEEKVFVVRFEKEGMRFAVPFSDMKRAKDGEKILKKSAGVSNVSVTQDILKPGVSMSKFRTQQEGKIVTESKMGEYFLDMQMDAQEMKERDFINKYKGEMGMSPQELKRMHKEFNEEVEIEESLFGAMYDKFVKAAKSMSKDKFVKTYTGKQVMPGQTKSMGKKDLEDIWVDFNEEVDNSLMAQATRVISHTSIKEKIDPADIDNIATADDRKAADKNIIIQLRRAQDMQGKADVTFKDKPNKKEKIDIRVINKALDMFDKMRPNDKAKMQTTIGKSYRDLLKTVQRGRIWNTLTQKRTVLKKQSLRL